MAKRAPSYIIVFAMLLVAMVASYWVRAKPVRVLFSADLNSLPLQITGWNGTKGTFSEDLRKVLEADSIASVTYTNESYAEPLGLLVVYRQYGRRGFVHRPEMCYPAAGWQIVRNSYTTVPYDGRDIAAREVVAENDNAREVIVYWFASGERTEANYVKQQYWMTLDRLKTQKYGWAFIRINCPVVTSDEATRQTIRSFARAASPALVKILRGSDQKPISDRRTRQGNRAEGAKS